MSSIKEQKQTLREKVLKNRLSISKNIWKRKSDLIINSLIESDFFDKADVVHTYLSMNKRNEVCTDLLVDKMLSSYKRVIVPITNFERGTLSHSELISTNDLKMNKWGVKEPDTIHEINLEEVDMIIVPMAAADKKGNRLGYGKGFYDRFLSKTKAKKVGLIFSDFLFDEIPTEKFDVKLDVIISEEEMIFA